MSRSEDTMQRMRRESRATTTPTLSQRARRTRLPRRPSRLAFSRNRSRIPPPHLLRDRLLRCHAHLLHSHVLLLPRRYPYNVQVHPPLSPFHLPRQLLCPTRACPVSRSGIRGSG